ncbi:glycosyltransferase [Chaetomidium leptoderma]|uniref:UDP-N-acetylglucosamine transferase subunit ALG13 n=1 Tax=Chaetomidium leptoderma TaxID=669021 RepID=A0AAN6VG82_9PEZI|nr:glycosyltransferase [Chaetomidium leptoderma]
MVNGVNEVEGGGDGASSSGSDTVTAARARMLKRQRIDFSDDGSQAHQTTALPGRRCFVTVGATAGFRSLLEEVSTAGFLQGLAAHGYTILDVQCGPDHAAFQSRVAALSDEDRHGVSVRSFGYTGEMNAYILDCRGEENVRPAGCVISHGGTGTIGEVLGVGAPLIVVANPTLMDNHQLELAESLEERGLAVHGHIGTLVSAIDRIAERITQGTLDALPPYSPPPFPVAAADRVTLFDWMVLTCYPDQLAAQTHLSNLGMAEADFANEQQQLPVAGNGNGPALAVNNQENNGMLQLD